MKKLIFGILAVGFFIVLACNPKASEADKKNESTEKTEGFTSNSLYAVAVDTAMKHIKHYDTLAHKLLHEIPVRAYTIRAADLLEAIGMPVADTAKATFKYVRVYLGLNHKNHFKLYLTPVVGANLNANPPLAGRDTILHGNFKGLGTSGGYMLDFNQPCPNTCPTN